MSEFDNIVQDAKSLFEDFFGDDVVYTLEAGTSSTVTADVQIDADDFENVGRGENRQRLATLIGDVTIFGNWKRGDTVTAKGATWQFDREDGRDAAFVRIRLSESENVRRVADNERIRRGR
jgi:hypothetical protein